MLKFFVDAAGWSGMLLLLHAYYLLSVRKLPATSNLYQAENIAGALLLMASAVYYGSYPNAALEVVWIAIGIYTLATRNRVKAT